MTLDNRKVPNIVLSVFDSERHFDFHILPFSLAYSTIIFILQGMLAPFSLLSHRGASHKADDLNTLMTAVLMWIGSGFQGCDWDTTLRSRPRTCH